MILHHWSILLNMHSRQQVKAKTSDTHVKSENIKDKYVADSKHSLLLQGLIAEKITVFHIRPLNVNSNVDNTRIVYDYSLSCKLNTTRTLRKISFLWRWGSWTVQ